ncbi:unnamed protein product [Alopecurus aequalis]
MGNHLKSSFIYLVLLSIAVTIGHCEVVWSQHSVSYNPHPQDFPDEQLYVAYLVIQKFKKTITSDPKNITATWTGYDLCGERSYTGFYCGAPPAPGRANKLTITAVILNGFRLHAPTLQGFVDQLPDLALFHAASNNFGGDIPGLAGLGYMYQLGVSTDQVAHTTADEAAVEGAADAKYRCLSVHLRFKFHVGGNGKGGGNGLTGAKALLLNHNKLSGPLPANLGFSKLSYLALAHNNLTGRIPPSILHLQDSLLELLLLNNHLSGCLPHQLGMLTRSSVIDVGMNHLTGPIPSSFSCLTSVEQLNLAGNRLYGDVPDALCNLASPAGRLANLTLSSNYFTSVGPACSALIKDGVLDVKQNCIPGFANQKRPAECASFLSQPKTCPDSSTRVACPDADTKKNGPPATEGTLAPRDYTSYVTYATMHE